MTELVFVDTGPWIALSDPRDQWHSLAVRTMERVRQERYSLVTSNLVLIETYSGLVGRIQRKAIVRLRSTVLGSASIQVVRIDEATEDFAWRLFMRYDDKTVSFVDCTSFAVMEQLAITTAFTFDRHFRQVGFLTLPAVK
ncbi:MAG: PIN domain-containing protein [Anaerolineae bacterium]|nr:PIN domain-containing protein [Anaerolineae bacterium]